MEEEEQEEEEEEVEEEVVWMSLRYLMEIFRSKQSQQSPYRFKIEIIADKKR